ncbi:hypothetical protein [Corynebacterium freneyi]|uniref:hypothetical protein n=1 Tax=Corynebacterium freneyi TaxID=134034 RepID=UPI001CCBDD4E|nr:hypothetical protein [Corynebacterium freneyi]UBI01559.1 hypothetical protein LA334_08485 [Corynebacterium freneyi]
MTMEKFHYDTPHGEVVLPWQENLPIKLIRANRRKTQDEQVWEFIEYAAGEETLAIIDELTLGEFQKLVEAWSNKSETNLGESKAS